MSAIIAATVVASGSIFFSGSSQNTGNVTAAGCTYFNDDSDNNGVVNGCVEYVVAQPEAYITSDPPLLAHWQTNSGPSGSFRRIVITGSTNAAQLSAIGRSGSTIYGPWQACPLEGCWTNPAAYRALEFGDYVLDYTYNPNYEVEPL